MIITDNIKSSTNQKQILIINKTYNQKHPYHILTSSCLPILAANSSWWDYATPTNAAIAIGVVAAIAFLVFTPQGHAICSSAGQVFLGAAGALSGGASPGRPTDSPSAPIGEFPTQFLSQQKMEGSNSSTSIDQGSKPAEVAETSIQEQIPNTIDASTQTDQVVNQYLSVETGSLLTEEFAASHTVNMSVQNIVPGLPPIQVEQLVMHGSQCTSRIAHHTTNETLQVLYRNEIPLDSQIISEVLATNQAAVANGYAAGFDGATRLLNSGGNSAIVPPELLNQIDSVTPATVAYSQSILSHKESQQLSSVIEGTITYHSITIFCILLISGLIWFFFPLQHRRGG